MLSLEIDELPGCWLMVIRRDLFAGEAYPIPTGPEL